MKSKPIMALFGSVQIPMAYCPDCKSNVFIIKNKFACCDKDYPGMSKNYKRMSEPEQKRKLPKLADRKRKLMEQDYKCFYCENTFGTFVTRNGRPKKIKIEWDHMIPYSLTQNNNETNFVAACDICNRLKSSKVFQTVDEAKIYLKNKWETKNYEQIQ